MATTKKAATKKSVKPPPAKRGRPEKFPGGSTQVFFFLPKAHLQEAKDAIEKFLTGYQPKKKYKQGELL